ncbi:MAG: HEAT repeat domain-containing protein, partial [Acidobacteriota bacterium]
MAMITYVDDSPIDDAKLRNELAAATAALTTSDNDLKSLEVILNFFGEEHVKYVGVSFFFLSKDDVKQNAHKIIDDAHSVDLLARAITDGSDLAAYYAILRLSNQKLNSRLPIEEYHKHLMSRHGFIDEAAEALLREPLAIAMRSRTGRVRAAALKLLSDISDEKDRVPFVMKHIRDPDELVSAAAISQIGRDDRFRDQEVLPVVWHAIRNSNTEELLVSCCDFLWLRSSIEQSDFTRRAELFERLAANSSTKVRQAVTRAISMASTAEAPRLIAILLKLAEDSEPLVRYDAIRSLRNAKTAEVRAKLLEYFDQGQPQMVRTAALEVLGVFGIENEAV